MRNLKETRSVLRLSQSALARLAGVPRVHICLHELGDRSLTAQEERRVCTAIQRERGKLLRALHSVAVA